MIDFTTGAARVELEREQVEQLTAAGVLVTDDRRRRPLYFDGRFLAARDLTREQNYFLTRQSDLGRVYGAGVVNGLLVSALENAATTIHVQAGLGVTPSGELVVLPHGQDIDLIDVPEIQRLDASFGLLRLPRDVPRNRSGLFIVALRPVEFSANPIASYPTSITGARSVEDGDIVEGVVVTLIPYPDNGTTVEAGLRRARVAREIFVLGGQPGLPVDVLPLAMIALERGLVRWVDPFLVRREVGAEQGGVLGLGVAARALHEAHLLQYEFHLHDILSRRTERRFAATDHFLALPPVGRMPAGAIDVDTFTQAYFPVGVDVDLSIIADDEAPALVEESLRLPPLDLTLSAEQQESTSVLVLITVPRPEVRRLKATLSSLTRQLLPAAPQMVALRKPLEVLRGLQLPRTPEPLILDRRDLTDAAWREKLAGANLLWYIRRRNISYKAEITGAIVPLITNDVDAERDLGSWIRDLGLTRDLGRVRRRASAIATADIVSMLAARKFTDSNLLTRAAVHELETVAPVTPQPEAPRAIDRGAVLKVAVRFDDPQMGEGVKRLEALNPEINRTPQIVNTLVQAQLVPELDALARQLSDAELADFTTQLVTEAGSGSVEGVKTLIDARMRK